MVVIGGGAAGLMAAYAAAQKNHVVLLEQNEKLGKKIYITGKGRCNLTNDISPAEYLQNVVSNGKFLTGCIYSFPPERTMEFFERGGLRLKVERGNRVFPLSDHASDVTKTLESYCKSAQVDVHLGEKVVSITKQSTMFDIITTKNTYLADAVVICTGGRSYPATGSTGDGYRFAAELGHSIVPLRPALCGIELKDADCRGLQGLALKNVKVSAVAGKKEIASFFGEMLFTHFGISGPVVLSLSSRINRLDLSGVELRLDLKPALSEEQLDRRVLRDFELYQNRQLCHALSDLLPKRLIPAVIARSGIPPEKSVHSITKAERKGLISALKCFIMKPSSLRSLEESIVTAGGVSVKEVNPKTMESRLVPGLYFCGEVLDVDAYTGGFNLQIAFSTGYAAGKAIE